MLQKVDLCLTLKLYQLLLSGFLEDRSAVHLLICQTAHCMKNMISAYTYAQFLEAERVAQGRWVGSPKG